MKRILQILAIVAMIVAHLAVYLAPEDAFQGLPQKIFYFHVSSAWAAYYMLVWALVGSIRVLMAGDGQTGVVDRFSPMASSAVEVALVLFTVLNVTGPIWAKPIWGTWWQWDPRLTTNFVLWLTLAVATLLRSALPYTVRNARIFAVLAVFAAANVPVVHYSVTWWRSLHPSPVVMQEKIGGGVDSDMVPALLIMLVATTLMAHALHWAAWDIEKQRVRGS